MNRRQISKAINRPQVGQVSVPISPLLQVLPSRLTNKEAPPRNKPEAAKNNGPGGSFWKAESGLTCVRSLSVPWLRFEISQILPEGYKNCYEASCVAILCVHVLLLWMNSVLALVFYTVRIQREPKLSIFNPTIARSREATPRPYGGSYRLS